MDSFFTFVFATNLTLIVLTKNEIKHIASLQRKTERVVHGLFVAEGEKIVAELLLHPFFRITQLCATKRWITENKAAALEHSAILSEVSEKDLERISSLATPNEVLAVCGIPESDFLPQNLSGRLSLALDDIRDPGNLGAILRIADWFGIEHIICSEDTVDVYNSKVIQASMGSFLRVKVHYVPLDSFLSTISLPVLGAVLDGENLFSMKLPAEGILLMGNESRGISKTILDRCNNRISIPNFSVSSTGRAESLNVAVATAVICSEFYRQKLVF
jgi:TrmH family RNA methyltransferase